MIGITILHLVCLTGIVAAMILVGTQTNWPEAIVGMGLQYVGVVLLIGQASGAAAAVIEAIVAAGTLALLASGGYLARPTVAGRIGSRRRTGASRNVGAPTASRVVIQIKVAARRIVTEWRARPFETSVGVLAIIGAVGLAIARPIFGSVGLDGVLDVLVIGGVLCCLLGGDARASGGLLFIASAGALALNAADDRLKPGESLLLAVAQVTLALAIVYLRARGKEVPTTRSNSADLAATSREPTSGDVSRSMAETAERPPW